MDYLVKLCTRQGRSEEKETKATNHNQSFILQQTNNKCVRKTGVELVSELRYFDCKNVKYKKLENMYKKIKKHVSFFENYFKSTVKLGYNEHLGTGQICSL